MMNSVRHILFLVFILLLNGSFHSAPERTPPMIYASLPVLDSVFMPDLEQLPSNYFQSPLDVPLTIVGNFGEPRRAHFHTGLDFRTNQEEGHVVFATADGYISRINVSGAGYGNALYITHPNGFVTVYGHLLKFHPRIERRLRAEQYAKENFTVDFNLQVNEIAVKQGDTIAFSGNTGGSGGPHLHFEIRDSLERIYNPMLFDYKLKDNIKPTISYLKFYPLDALKNKCDGYRIKPVGKLGQYEIPTGTVKLNDKLVGISVNAYDGINLSESHIGIYNMTAFDGDKMIYEFQIDRIAFTDKRTVFSHIDYPVFMHEGKKSFHKAFKDPGNNCPVYSNLQNRGMVDLSDGKVHRLHIEISDFAGNVSAVKFNLQYDPASILFKETPFRYTTKFDYDHLNEFSNSDISLKIPAGCLFDDVYFNYSSFVSVDPSIFSKVHQLDNSNTLSNDWFDLSIKVENLATALNDKAIIVYKGSDGVATARGGKYEKGFITTRARDFGSYYIRIDTTAPKISPLNVLPGRNMRNYKKLLFKITDNLSGITDFDTYLDGQWIVTEYDAKTFTLFHYLNPSLAAGEHTFKVVVTDERNNRSEYSVSFLM